jgi:hypothetical protein
LWLYPRCYFTDGYLVNLWFSRQFQVYEFLGWGPVTWEAGIPFLKRAPSILKINAVDSPQTSETTL